MVTHCVGETANMTSLVVPASGGGTGSPAASPSPTQIDTTTASNTISTIQSSTQPQRRPGENRRSNKPIMEKRRRARINNCLNELKSLILDAMKKDPARHSKLEKADILEMTVKHLENMQRQQVAMTVATDPQVLNKFRAGFSECAGEVGRFPGLEPPVRRRLLQHLANVLNTNVGSESTGLNNSSNNTTPVVAVASNQTGQSATSTVQTTGVQVHILPAPSDCSSQSGILFSTTTSGGGLHLVPTRLPNGDIALVLPSTNRQILTPSPNSTSSSSSTPSNSSPVPMLIPIPPRNSSTNQLKASTLTSINTEIPPKITVSSSTSPISFDRLSVSSTPSPQPDLNSQHYENLQHSPNQRSESCSPELSQFVNTTFSHEVHEQSNEILDSHSMQRSYIPQQTDPKPLSLVMKKHYQEVSSDDKPWRPW